MIVAIAVTADCGTKAALAARFGRAAGFLLCNTETGEHSFLSNDQNLNAPQGAGIQAARHVVEGGAEAVIARHCGPKAFHVLQATGIPVFLTKASTAAEALADKKAGLLERQDAPDQEGHWI